MTVDNWQRLGLDFPSKIQLQTINLCNYACGMCPYPELGEGRTKTLLPDALYDKLLGELAERRRKVQLCLMLQNEPLLDRRFVELVARAHANAFVSSIATVSNGSVLDLATLDELMAFERFQLTISVNATDRERYRQVHGRDRFDAIAELLGSWQGPRERIALSCVVSAEHPHDFVEFERHWLPLGYRVRLVPMSTRISAKPLNRAVLKVVQNFGRCRYPLDTMTILADGRVVLCGQDWKHSTSFGNIAQQTLADIWNAPEASEIRQAAISGTLRDVPGCARCDYPLRSVERVALEHEIGGSSLPALAGSVLPHRSYLRCGDGSVTPIAVKEIEADGSVVVFSQEPLGDLTGSVEFVMCFAYENGYFSEMPCRASLLPLEQRSRGGLRAFRVRLDTSDPRFSLWGWYAEDWRTARAGAAC